MYKVMNCINKEVVFLESPETVLIYCYSFNYPGEFIGFEAGLNALKDHFEIANKLFNDIEKYSIIHINGAAIASCSDESSAPIFPGENTPPACIDRDLFTDTPPLDYKPRTAKKGPKTTNINSNISINKYGEISL